MGRTRIILADDHKMFLQGLQSLLQDGFDLVGVFENGQALVDAAPGLDADVIIVDISMPVLNGFDAVRRLNEQGITAKIIFLTMHADPRLLAEAFSCGGSGYVLKQCAGEDLTLAIAQVLAGQKYVTPLIANEWDQTISTPVNGNRKLTLTSRKRQVLQMVVEGCTMKEIATHLGISPRTVESHKDEMMKGLGVDNTAELIQYAIKLGFSPGTTVHGSALPFQRQDSGDATGPSWNSKNSN